MIIFTQFLCFFLCNFYDILIARKEYIQYVVSNSTQNVHKMDNYKILKINK
jgi:hypothetical protein